MLLVSKRQSAHREASESYFLTLLAMAMYDAQNWPLAGLVVLAAIVAAVSDLAATG